MRREETKHLSNHYQVRYMECDRHTFLLMLSLPLSVTRMQECIIALLTGS